MTTSETAQQLRALHAESFRWVVACAQGDRDLAEEVLQATYVRVLDGELVCGGRSSFKTWLFAVLRRSVRDRRRKRGWRAGLLATWWPRDALALSERAERRGPHSRLSDRERESAVRRQLARLSDRQREVLELVFYHQLPLSEAAQVMGVTRGTASRHYDRGKSALGAGLEQEGILGAGD